MGSYDTDKKWKFDRKPGKDLPNDKPVGREVTFITAKPMDFDDWKPSQSVRLIQSEIGIVKKFGQSMLQFRNVDTYPGSLVFDLSRWKWTLRPVLEVAVLSGSLDVVSGDSSNFIVDQGAPDVIPIAKSDQFHHILLLTFPTGKAGLNDLTTDDRTDLTNFVTNAAKGIASVL